MRRNSWFLDTLAILLFLCVIGLMVMHRMRSTAAYVRIQSREGTFLYPLSEDRTITVDGPLGATVIQIKERKVTFLSSPCAGQDCVHHAPLCRGGATSACLPNQVLAIIEGQEEVDDVAT